MMGIPAKREFDIDWFRGLVCLSLAMLHVYNSPLYDSYYRLFGETGKSIVWDWLLGVENFYILAGFMMAHMMRPVPGERISIGGYVKRRFFRLLLPYWVAMAIFAILQWSVGLLSGKTDAMPTIVEVLAQIGLVQEFVIAPDRLVNDTVVPIGYWSMVSLEQFYLLWMACYTICRGIFGRGAGYGRAERAMIVVTFLACIGSLVLLVENVKMKMELPLFTVYLTLGMLLYWSIRQNVYSALFWVAWGLLFAGFLYNGNPRMIKALIVAMMFIPLAKGYRAPDCLAIRVLSYCGKRSYSIYLIHSIAGMFFLRLTWRLTEKSDWMALPLSAAAFAVFIAAAMIYYRYQELPCQARAQRVSYRRRRGSHLESSQIISSGNPAGLRYRSAGSRKIVLPVQNRTFKV